MHFVFSILVKYFNKFLYILTRGLRPLVLPGLLDGKSLKLKEY